MKDAEFISNPDPARPSSRYNLIRLYVNREAQMVQERWDPPNLDPRPDDSSHEVKPGEDHRPDLIALDHYGDLGLYWVVGRANLMVDAFAETMAGRVLRLPSAEYVFSILTAR